MKSQISVEALFDRATKLDALTAHAACVADAAWKAHAEAVKQADEAMTFADALRRCTGSVSVTYDDGRGNVAVSQAAR